MPQQHPGRLKILVVDAHCKRRLFSTKTPTDPDELARRFCTPDNCLVVVLRDNRFLFRSAHPSGVLHPVIRRCSLETIQTRTPVHRDGLP